MAQAAPDNQQPGRTLRDVYPHLSEAQLHEAEENFARYIELALRIYQRIRSDEDAYAHFKTLTAAKRTRYDVQQRSNPS